MPSNAKSYTFTPKKGLDLETVKQLGVENKIWVNQEFPGTPLYVAIPARAGAFGLLKYKLSWKYLYLCFDQNYIRLLESLDGLKNSFETMINLELKKTGFWQKNYRTWQIKELEFLKRVDRFLELDINKLNKRELKVFTVKFFKNLFELESMGVLHDEVIAYTDELIKNTSKDNPRLAKAFSELLISSVKSFLQQEEEELVNIGLRGCRKADLDKHVKNYFWIQSNYVKASDLNSENFISRLKQIGKTPRELQKHKDHIEQLLEELKKKQLLAWKNVENKVDKRVYTALKIGNLFSRWRDRRKRVNLLSFVILEKLVLFLSKLHNANANDIKYLLPEELIDAISSKSIVKTGRVRRTGFSQFWVENKEGQFIQKQHQYMHGLYDKVTFREAKELKGIAASPGKVKGIAKIVLDPQKTSKLPPNSILVTSMTRPEFVPLMKQSVAIVTDEGGMLSHAAIVSRELQIPCVIGTKFATKNLKDGSVIEVDGDKGLVKILK